MGQEEDFIQRVREDLRVLHAADTDALTQSVQDQLAALGWDIAEALAYHPLASRETLDCLAVHYSKHVRRSVAENVNAPLELLELLAGDPASEVRRGLVLRLNLPVSVQRKLTQAEDVQSLRILIQRSDFQWDLRFAAKFYAYWHPNLSDVFCEHLTTPELEVAWALLDEWKGTLQELIEAAHLVNA